jgi:hypothetical protein
VSASGDGEEEREREKRGRNGKAKWERGERKGYEVVDAEGKAGVGAGGREVERGGDLLHALVGHHFVEPASLGDLLVELVQVDLALAQLRYPIYRRTGHITTTTTTNKYLFVCFCFCFLFVFVFCLIKKIKRIKVH